MLTSFLLVLVALGFPLDSSLPTSPGTYDSCNVTVSCGFSPGTGGDDVEVWRGDWGYIPTTPEDPGQPVSDPDTDDGTGDGGGMAPDPEPGPPGPGDPCWDNLAPLACTPIAPTPAPEQPIYPDTIYNTDLITFTPHEPTATAPNEAMALANTPLPITLTTTTHTIAGTLLGHPVTVTFTPAGYTLDHGDNTTPAHTTSNPATITHTYTARGAHPTTIATHYTATVTFPDNVPRPVLGTITTATPGPTTRILTARTAPVRTTCTTVPTPLGC